MKSFYDFFIIAAIVLFIVGCGLPELMEIRSIIAQNPSVVWFLLFSIILFTIWLYWLNKFKKSLKKQIITAIIGIAVYMIALILLCYS